MPSNLIPIAALIQSVEKALALWRIETKNSAAFAAFFKRFDHSAILKIGLMEKNERKMTHLNIAFDRYASIGTVMHYILVISEPEPPVVQKQRTLPSCNSRIRTKLIC